MSAAETDAEAAPEAPWAALPAGDYAIVEIFGHSTLVGRVEEVERFGTKMLMVEPIFAGQLLEPVLQGGGSIYRFTPCTAETAWAQAPKQRYQLPRAVAVRLGPAQLPPPDPGRDEDTGADWEIPGDVEDEIP